MRAQIRVGRILGFPIGLSWSAVAVFALVTWSLATPGLPGSGDS
jgi:hypothetical protein